MGMTGGIYRASDSEIQKLRAEPHTIGDFIEGSGWAPPVREVRPKGVLGWLLKLTPITIEEVDPTAVPPSYYKEHERPHCDLDKAWHGLHFLLTGTAWEGEEPACYLVRGGEDLGDADELGYNVIQALSPPRVQRLAAFLNSLSRQELERRFDPERMMALDIYPEIWTRDSACEYLLDASDELRTFVNTLGDSGDGAIVYLT